MVLVWAGLPEETVKYLNGIYRETVSGSQKDLFSLDVALLDEEMLSKGFVHQQVLVLNNTLEHRLDLHYIQCWEDFNRTKIQLLQHTVPTRNVADSRDEDLLLTELRTYLGVSRLDIQSVSDTYKQELVVPPLAGGVNLVYVMLEKDVKVKRQDLRVFVITSGSPTNYIFPQELGPPEPQSPRVSQSSSSTALIIFLTASVACIVSVALTFIGVASYYKRYQALPCLKTAERSLAFDLK